MKRFYVSCGALVVGFLLVGSVHAGPHHSNQRSGHRSRHYSGHYRRVIQPRLLQLPRLRIPEQSPGWWGYDPDSGGYGPDSGTDDPNSVGYPPGEDIGGGNVALPPVTPEVGSQIGTDDPVAGGEDTTSEDSQLGRDIGGGIAARSAVTPKVGGQRQLHKFNNRSSGVTGSRPRRR